MPNKSQIDSETKTPKGDESYLERYNRVRKRIAWGLDINEEEKEFLKKIGEDKEPKREPIEDHAEKVWETACKGFSYPYENAPDYDAASTAPPEIKTGERGGRYTEGKTKDGRPYRRYF